jgi:hypothetical protein
MPLTYTTPDLDGHPMADKIADAIARKDHSYLEGVRKVEASMGKMSVANFLQSQEG